MQELSGNTDVRQWLVALKFEEEDIQSYTKALRSGGYDDIESLLFIDQDELTAEYGLKPGHARKVLFHLRQARSSADVEVAVSAAKSQGARAMIKLMETRPFELGLQVKNDRMSNSSPVLVF